MFNMFELSETIKFQADINTVIELALLAAVVYLAVYVRDLRLRLDDYKRRHADDQDKIEALTVTVEALRYGVHLSRDVAERVTVDDLDRFGTNGGVRTFAELSGEAWSLEDIQTLAFELGVDYDQLAGDGKTVKAREMVKWFVARGRLAELKLAMRAKRTGAGAGAGDPRPGRRL